MSHPFPPLSGPLVLDAVVWSPSPSSSPPAAAAAAAATSQNAAPPSVRGSTPTPASTQDDSVGTAPSQSPQSVRSPSLTRALSRGSSSSVSSGPLSPRSHNHSRSISFTMSLPFTNTNITSPTNNNKKKINSPSITLPSTSSQSMSPPPLPPSLALLKLRLLHQSTSLLDYLQHYLHYSCKKGLSGEVSDVLDQFNGESVFAPPSRSSAPFSEQPSGSSARDPLNKQQHNNALTLTTASHTARGLAAHASQTRRQTTLIPVVDDQFFRVQAHKHAEQQQRRYLKQLNKKRREEQEETARQYKGRRGEVDMSSDPHPHWKTLRSLRAVYEQRAEASATPARLKLPTIEKKIRQSKIHTHKSTNTHSQLALPSLLHSSSPSHLASPAPLFLLHPPLAPRSHHRGRNALGYKMMTRTLTQHKREEKSDDSSFDPSSSFLPTNTYRVSVVGVSPSVSPPPPRDLQGSVTTGHNKHNNINQSIHKNHTLPTSNLSLLLNFTDRNGSTALFHVCWEGHIHIIQMLLEKGADPNVRNLRQHAAIEMAIEKGYMDAVKLLLRYGSNCCRIEAKRARQRAHFRMGAAYVNWLRSRNNPAKEKVIEDAGKYELIHQQLHEVDHRILQLFRHTAFENWQSLSKSERRTKGRAMDRERWQREHPTMNAHTQALYTSYDEWCDHLELDESIKCRSSMHLSLLSRPSLCSRMSHGATLLYHACWHGWYQGAEAILTRAWQHCQINKLCVDELKTEEEEKFEAAYRKKMEKRESLLENARRRRQLELHRQRSKFVDDRDSSDSDFEDIRPKDDMLDDTIDTRPQLLLWRQWYVDAPDQEAASDQHSAVNTQLNHISIPVPTNNSQIRYETAVYIAFRRQHFSLALLLQQYGALLPYTREELERLRDIQSKSRQLMQLIRDENMEAIEEMMMECQAMEYIADNGKHHAYRLQVISYQELNSDCPFTLCVQLGHIQILDFLLRSCVKPYSHNMMHSPHFPFISLSKLHTPLHRSLVSLAIEKHDLNMVKYLVEHECTLTIADLTTIISQDYERAVQFPSDTNYLTHQHTMEFIQEILFLSLQQHFQSAHADSSLTSTTRRVSKKLRSTLSLSEFESALNESPTMFIPTTMEELRTIIQHLKAYENKMQKYTSLTIKNEEESINEHLVTPLLSPLTKAKTIHYELTRLTNANDGEGESEAVEVHHSNIETDEEKSTHISAHQRRPSYINTISVSNDDNEEELTMSMNECEDTEMLRIDEEKEEDDEVELGDLPTSPLQSASPYSSTLSNLSTFLLPSSLQQRIARRRRRRLLDRQLRIESGQVDASMAIQELSEHESDADSEKSDDDEDAGNDTSTTSLLSLSHAVARADDVNDALPSGLPAGVGTVYRDRDGSFVLTGAQIDTSLAKKLIGYDPPKPKPPVPIHEIFAKKWREKSRRKTEEKEKQDGQDINSDVDSLLPHSPSNASHSHSGDVPSLHRRVSGPSSPRSDSRHSATSMKNQFARLSLVFRKDPNDPTSSRNRGNARLSSDVSHSLTINVNQRTDTEDDDEHNQQAINKSEQHQHANATDQQAPLYSHIPPPLQQSLHAIFQDLQQDFVNSSTLKIPTASIPIDLQDPKWHFVVKSNPHLSAYLGMNVPVSPISGGVGSEASSNSSSLAPSRRSTIEAKQQQNLTDTLAAFIKKHRRQGSLVEDGMKVPEDVAVHDYQIEVKTVNLEQWMECFELMGRDTSHGVDSVQEWVDEFWQLVEMLAESAAAEAKQAEAKLLQKRQAALLARLERAAARSQVEVDPTSILTLSAQLRSTDVDVGDNPATFVSQQYGNVSLNDCIFDYYPHLDQNTQYAAIQQPKSITYQMLVQGKTSEAIYKEIEEGKAISNEQHEDDEDDED